MALREVFLSRDHGRMRKGAMRGTQAKKTLSPSAEVGANLACSENDKKLVCDWLHAQSRECREIT